MGHVRTEITIMAEEETNDNSEQVLVNALTRESLRKILKPPAERPHSHRPHRTPSPNRARVTSANHLDLPGDDSVHSSRLSIREQLEKSTILDDYATTPKLCGIIPYPGCCQGEPERELPEELRPNPELEEGKPLPNDYEPFPEDLCGKPVQEVDPNRTSLKSFVIISKRMGRNTIYRFSATKSLYLLDPLHPLRRGMLYLATNQWFDALVILFILSNCVFLALPKPVEIAEFIFQAFYTIEMIIRILARGFTLEKHTYLRDPWNFLDFFVVMIGYGIIVLEHTNSGPEFSFNVSALRTFRVLRALKTISVIPGLRTIVNALLNSLRMLAEVMVLMVFCLCVASLMGLQLYMGALRSKCVADGPTNMTDQEYEQHINNASNWQVHVSFDETYQVCGNESYSGECPSSYKCIAVGNNPNWGYTNFDNIGWSLVASFQLITLDYWENVYDLILMSKGPWNVLFFVILVFFGSFYLINLMLAVVTLSYDEESVNVQNEEEEEQKSKDRMEKREHDKAAASEAKKDPDTTIQNAFEKTPEQTEGAKTSAVNDENNEDDEEEGEDVLPEDPEAQMERMQLMWCCGPGKTGCCVCCGTASSNKWFPVQLVIYKWVTDPIFDIMVTLLIFINTLFLALDYHNMPTILKEILGWGNQIFTAFFCVEAMLKIVAMGKEYFKNSWNVFDFVIVVFSIVEIIVSTSINNANIDGLTILRVLRLMRVFKLARSWATMRILLSIIGSTLGALGNLTLVLVIVIYIFAVIGMQLLGDGYTEKKWESLSTIGGEIAEVPRWNFKDFFHSFMMVFRILCGEWIETLFDCMRVKGVPLCMIIIITTLVIGNFLVLNLFLALLLNKFGQENLKKQKQMQQNTRMKAGWKRLQGLLKKNTRVQPRFLDVINAAKAGDDDEEAVTISPLLRALRQAKAEGKLAEVQEELEKEFEQLKKQTAPRIIINTPSSNKAEDDDADGGKEPNGTVSNGHLAGYRDPDTQEAFEVLQQMSKTEKGATKSRPRDDTRVSPMKAKQMIDKKSGKHSLKFSNDKEGVDDKGTKAKKEEEKKEAEKVLVDCFPTLITSRISCCDSVTRTSFGRVWVKFRKICFDIVEHKLFEWFILVIILISSISLAFEDIHLSKRPKLEMTLQMMNYVFVAIFTVEMLLKWFGLGFKVYFTNGWCWLDFFIVMVSYTSIIMESVLQNNSLAALRSLRTLRALRPLRAISRWQGMKIVVNALASAIPSIFNVLLVCIVFWLIFSIMGVQLMKGRFYACYERSSGERIDCVINGTKITRDWCDARSDLYRWTNQKVNFDNVLIGYLALFQVATFEGWMEVMEAGVDGTDIDKQPCAESNIYFIYPYFVIFIVCGSFFTLNLIIGVIIDNFQTLRRQYDGEGAVDVMLTTSQKNYYQTLKRLAARKPQKTVKRPKNKVMAFFFDISTSTKFEISIAIVILCNMLTMAFDHYEMNAGWEYALFCLNIMFTTIYTLEAIVKVIGLRQQYFLYGWNIFDLLIVLISIADIIMEALMDNNTIFITPGTLRVVRLFRIGRVLRLIKAAKGIRKLLFAFLISIPALFNIGCLLALMLFIYALIGMSLFGYTKHNGMINSKVNFETFLNSMILLFRLMTSGGWNDILDALSVDEESGGCNPKLENAGLQGDCGIFYLAIAYMVSFLLVNFLIIINMYIAIILENFNNAHQQEEIGITEDDLEMFYQVWQRYDPQATEFIHYLSLPDFFDDLDQPFRLPKPNGIKIVTLRLTINQDEKVHCLDILKQLIRYVLQSHSYDNADVLKDLINKVEEKFVETFPTLKSQVPKSDTFKRKQEENAVRKIQKAWFHHKFRQTIRRASSTGMQALKLSNLVPLITKNQQLNGALDTSGSTRSHGGSSEDVSQVHSPHPARTSSPANRT